MCFIKIKSTTMKTFKLVSILSFLLFVIFSFAQTGGVKSETVKVWGNCGMCKSHIEKAAKEAGASYASWNKDTKILSVKYNAGKTSNQQIQEKVAAAGYDTRDLTGDEKAYNNLDDCCKYDRKAATADTKKGKQTAKMVCKPGEKCDMSACKMSGKECCTSKDGKMECKADATGKCCAS
jgi:hypothetical protein